MENSLSLPSKQLAHRHGEYGFDEPVWPLLFGLLGVIFVVLGVLSFGRVDNRILAVIWFVCALPWFFTAASYLYATRRGKFGSGQLFCCGLNCVEMSRSLIWDVVVALFS